MFKYKYSFKISVIIFLIFGYFSATNSMATEPGCIPNEAVKQILRHPKLAAFLHPEIDKRVPIVIQSHFVDPNIKLTMYGEPVVVEPDSKKLKTTNIFMSFFTNGKVSIHYPVEGVKGVFEFSYSDTGKWELKNANVWEY